MSFPLRIGVFMGSPWLKSSKPPTPSCLCVHLSVNVGQVCHVNCVGWGDPGFADPNCWSSRYWSEWLPSSYSSVSLSEFCGSGRHRMSYTGRHAPLVWPSAVLLSSTRTDSSFQPVQTAFCCCYFSTFPAARNDSWTSASTYVNT